MAFDETGQADNYERRIEICKRSYDILVDIVGFLPKISFDPNIFRLQLGWTNKLNALDFSERLNGLEKSAACQCKWRVSNVSFSFRNDIAVKRCILFSCIMRFKTE
jgi:5-methyltetrahydrofolate--homocysteine methyltransferase